MENTPSIDIEATVERLLDYAWKAAVFAKDGEDGEAEGMLDLLRDQTTEALNAAAGLQADRT